MNQLLLIIAPKFIVQWLRYRRVVKGDLEVESFATRLFETGEYGWDYRYKH